MQVRARGRSDRSGETNATAMRSSGARARAAMARGRVCGECNRLVCVSQNVRWKGRRRREEVFIAATREGREKTEGKEVWRPCGRRWGPRRGCGGGDRHSACGPCCCRVADADVADSIGTTPFGSAPVAKNASPPLTSVPHSCFFPPLSFRIHRPIWFGFHRGDCSLKLHRKMFYDTGYHVIELQSILCK
jgi:hypothetical protein